MKVEVKNLGMLYHDADRDVRVFENLNFEIPSGSSLAIVGESGVGKTTLLYLLGGLEQSSEGEVLIGETGLSALDDTRGELATFRGENIGFVFQFHQLLPEFTALENVAMPMLIQGSSHEEANQRAKDLLSRTGLAERLTHRPGQLSGGEQQRVAIARAVATKPGLILADEPTGNLDHRTGSTVTDLLIKLQREEGATLIVVTHSRELAAIMDSTVELTSEGIEVIN